MSSTAMITQQRWGGFVSIAIEVQNDLQLQHTLASKLEGPHAYTTMIDSTLQATIKDGLLATNIGFLGTLKPRLQIELITSASEVTYFVPTRNIWLQYQSIEDAKQVAEKLNNTVSHDLRLAAVVKGSNLGSIWSVQITNVTDRFDEATIKSLLPVGTPMPSKVKFGA
ncbi:hypothetical protein LTR62_000613 [Meristemomyces frigidus]|uniref:Uncharacterized protein n=1 Tax=Meristemomyces frigidus TaxID=1508187 RepID=A0AAN7YLH6_9PEZI|nr:hypothetical protein LTR62_000613 [Meristemomyces frigidus]